MFQTIKAWWKERQRFKELERQQRNCEKGEHDFHTLDEHHSILSLMCEMKNVPAQCSHCGIIVYADWVPGKGITRWDAVPDEDLTEKGRKANGRQPKN
jgi:hypothetical protein